MAYDCHAIAYEIDRLIRVGYTGPELLSRLASTYPDVGRADVSAALEHAKATAQRRLQAVERGSSGSAVKLPRRLVPDRGVANGFEVAWDARNAVQTSRTGRSSWGAPKARLKTKSLSASLT